MSEIKVLEKSIADKIAAGEVVERPLSVIKELVENSIDAGASSITVEIKKGGKEYIRVSDNGCGIPENQVETAFLRHATSKVRNLKDLDEICTLGFRGEALASIAAVSRTELLTKTEVASAGTRLFIEGGQVLDVKPYGTPDGTTVVVRDIFYNTPARLKFLKSDTTESSLIIDFLSRMAICYPNIKFRVINNASVLFSTRGNGDRLLAISTVYGHSEAEKLTPVDTVSSGISVTGYVSGVSYSRPNRKWQVFFVNGRSVESRIIDNAVKKAYEDKLFTGRFPVVYIFIQVPAALLDVNIHPNKLQVRFDDDRLVESVVVNAIRNALTEEKAAVNESNLLLTKSFVTESNAQEAEAQQTVDSSQEPSSKPETLEDYLSNLRRATDEADIKVKEEPAEYETQLEIPTNTAESKSFDFTELKIIDAVFDTYIAAADGDTLYFMDQHAAHERINYEKLMKGFFTGEISSQQLLVPDMIDIPARVVPVLDELIEALTKMGFDLCQFGPNTLKISAIPSFLENSEAQGFARDFMDNIEEGDDFRRTSVIERLSTSACKASVKANDRLSKAEIDALFRDLSECDNPYNCPHGRPVFIKFTKYQIEKLFKRV